MKGGSKNHLPLPDKIIDGKTLEENVSFFNIVGHGVQNGNVFVWVRAAFPRYRYDQLMRLGWKIFLPFSLGWLLFISGILLGFDWLI